MREPKSSRGFAAPVAVALMLLMGGVALSAYSVAQSGNELAFAVNARARAEDGARAGAEWGRLQGKAGRCVSSSVFSPSTSSSLPGLPDVTIKVTCSKTVSDTGEYVFTSTACLGSADGTCPVAAPPAGYAERTVVTRYYGP